MSLLEQKLYRMRLGMDTERYHTFKTLRCDTVAHHSHGVIGLAMLMTAHWPVESQLAVLKASYAHDLPEGGYNPHVALGDMPAPAKRNIPGLREAYNHAEATMMAPLNMAWEQDLTAEEHCVLKLADNLDGLFNCIAEFQLGNQNIVSTYNAYATWVSETVDSGTTMEFITARAIFDVAQDWWERAIRGPYGVMPYVRK